MVNMIDGGRVSHLHEENNLGSVSEGATETESIHTINRIEKGSLYMKKYKNLDAK
jgi:hypothetical protein